MQLRRSIEKLQLLEATSAVNINDFVSHWITLCEKKVPKGFEKYYPGAKKAATQPKSEEAKEGSAEKKEEEKKDDKKEDTEKRVPPIQSQRTTPKEFTFRKDFQFSFGKGPGDESNKWTTYGMMAAFCLLVYLAWNEMRYKEITWKEFISNYLARGIVEKLEVVNKKWVRVRFTPGNQVEASSVLWFNIGSVDTFERNLENIQLEMNIEPTNFVPVVYKSEIDGSNVIGMLPTLLMIGFLIWSVRRASNVMGSATGKKRGGIFGMGESTAKLINPSDIGVQFR